MLIGVPREIKNNENRVGMTPAGVANLCRAGHQVFVELDAGMGSGFTNEQYAQAGAEIVATAKEAWAQDMVIKVKEPIAEEYGFFRPGLVLFTYLHLAAAPELTEQLLAKKVVGIGYETVQLDNGHLPLLTPMSEIAGRMSVQIGAQLLEKPHGGKGILLSGVPGVRRARVTIIGAGVAGANATKLAIGLGARVTVMDVNLERMRHLDDIFGDDISTSMSDAYNIAEVVQGSDLVIGAVLIPGAKAPKLVSEAMIKSMEAGSVVVDIAIDQGGIFETCDHTTTHDKPTYTKHGVLHYAVANMPGAVPRTSTLALINSTLPYAMQIANLGYQEACRKDHCLRKGLNTCDGHITYPAVAAAMQGKFKSEYRAADLVLS